MTIKEAIQQLESIRKVDGDSIIVYFDCPCCKISTTPNKIVRVVKMEGKEKE